MEPLALAGAFLLPMSIYRDQRGCFFETWREQKMADAGLPARFVQDNVSLSQANVIRGLHLQHPNGQGKLVTVVVGRIRDVLVDVRVGSTTFAKWIAVDLSESDCRQLYVPPGLAHGFAVHSALAAVTYKCTTYYDPAQDLTVRWDDSALGIDWGVKDPILSEKDRHAPRLADIPLERLPRFEVGE